MSRSVNRLTERLANRFAALALRTTIRMCSWLSIAGGRRLAKQLVRIASHVGSEWERVTRINLKKCFPEWGDEQHDQVTLESLRHTLCVVIENGMLTHWSEERVLGAIVSETGRELLERQLAESRGVLVLLPHFGNWEVLGCALGSLRFVALYDPPRIASLDKLIRYSRERFGGTMVPTNQQGLRAMYRALKDNALTILLPDQVPDLAAGEFAPFFGQPTLTMTLAHRLVRQTKPFVMLGYAKRVEGGFEIHYEPLGDEFYADDAYSYAAALNLAIERLVRSDPAQYQWEYKRFKQQPEGYAEVYPKR